MQDTLLLCFILKNNKYKHLLKGSNLMIMIDYYNHLLEHQFEVDSDDLEL